MWAGSAGGSGGGVGGGVGGGGIGGRAGCWKGEGVGWWWWWWWWGRGGWEGQLKREVGEKVESLEVFLLGQMFLIA